MDIEIRKCYQQDYLLVYDRINPSFMSRRKPSDTFYIGAFLQGKCIGTVGYRIIGRRIEYVAALVDTRYRQKGVYSKLLDFREKVVSTIQHDYEFAYATKFSIVKFIKEGFQVYKTFKNTFYCKRTKI